MYTLAGNYKGDQVHAAKIVERLGGDPELAAPEPADENEDGEDEQ